MPLRHATVRGEAAISRRVCYARCCHDTVRFAAYEDSENNAACLFDAAATMRMFHAAADTTIRHADVIDYVISCDTYIRHITSL